MQAMPTLNLGNGRKFVSTLELEDSASPGPYVGRIDFQRPMIIRERFFCTTAVGERRTNSIIQQPILWIIRIKDYCVWSEARAHQDERITQHGNSPVIGYNPKISSQHLGPTEESPDTFTSFELSKIANAICTSASISVLLVPGWDTPLAMVMRQSISS
jgi:hypothetical protein